MPCREKKEEEKELIHQAASVHVHIFGHEDYGVSKAARTTWRKYFDYSPSYSDNPKKNISTISSSTSLTAACYARGLVVTHSLIRQRSGARHHLTPKCRNSCLWTAISSTSATRRSQQRSGAQRQLQLRSWLWFYDNNSTMSSSTTPRQPCRTW
jgi:hypothetical protein